MRVRSVTSAWYLTGPDRDVAREHVVEADAEPMPNAVDGATAFDCRRSRRRRARRAAPTETSNAGTRRITSSA